jgi:aminoglycoside 3-N-acetyltransferase
MTPRARKQIASQLREIGVRPGGALLVHSSLKSLGPVPGGPETVILGLLDALGPEGTLLMPALSFGSVNEADPIFDALYTQSNVGAIPEYFRTRPGTIRSVHPTHSLCAVGPRAEALLRDHYLDTTPAGPRSAFTKLPDIDGQLLMIGCGLKPNTSMHGVEELAEPPYLFREATTFHLIHADRTQTVMHCRRHNFPGLRQRYDRVGPLLDGNGMKTAKVLQATVHVIECPVMWQRALHALQQDPMFFVAPR